MKQDALTQCPVCKAEKYRKILSANPFMLIGEGWESYEKSGRYHIKGGT
jgi:predicted nucleic acid-binding Zn ribbon protein